MIRFHPVLLLVAMVLLASCAPLIQPVRVEGTAPTPIVETWPAGEDNPNVFADTQKFQAALVEALNARDAERLQMWMTEPFMTGWWRGERMDDPPADALRLMLNEYLGAENRLAVVEGADLYNLMGEQSPISLPRPEAGVESAFLVSGWGKDGRDEMIMFIARQPDNSLRWQGAVLVQGGFTARQAGGVQPFTNPAHGYRVYVPKGFEVLQPTASQVVFLAPGEGHRERGFISVEPANGRTVQEVTEAVKAEAVTAGLPLDQIQEIAIVAGIEGSPTLVLDKLPGQNLNRQVFVIHNDVLYRMMFVPSDQAAGDAYGQMENLYATILNTFHFLPGQGRNNSLPITDLVHFEEQLRKALAARDVNAARGLMGDTFTMAFWQSEGLEIAPAQAAEQMIVRFVPPGAPLTFENQADFASLFGDKNPVIVAVPVGETVYPVFVPDWGLEGRDEAVLYIAQRSDGSLYWKGVLTAQGGFPRPVIEATLPPGSVPVTGTQVQFVMAQRNVNMRTGPGMEYGTMSVIAEGQTAKVTGISADGYWWRVVCPDGSEGSCWVSALPELTQPAAAPGS